MRILDKRFRDCICQNIYDRIGIQMRGELIMIKGANSLERRIR
jgi:hypothetical protein